MPPGPHLLFPGCASVTSTSRSSSRPTGAGPLRERGGRGLSPSPAAANPGVLGLLDYAKENFDGFARVPRRVRRPATSPRSRSGAPRRRSCSTSCRRTTCRSSHATIARRDRGAEDAGSAACPWPAHGAPREQELPLPGERRHDRLLKRSCQRRRRRGGRSEVKRSRAGSSHGEPRNGAPPSEATQPNGEPRKRPTPGRTYTPWGTGPQQEERGYSVTRSSAR